MMMVLIKSYEQVYFVILTLKIEGGEETVIVGNCWLISNT